MRSKRRWTLGGLMLLIAATSVPLALTRQHLQRLERLKEVEADLIKIARLLQEHPELRHDPLGGQAGEYFEYGDDLAEPPK